MRVLLSLFFIFKIILSLPSHFHLHRNIRLSLLLSGEKKKVVEILIDIPSNW